MAQLPKFPTVTFPSFDFSGLDANKLAGLDEKVVAAVRDAAYVTIGFGVLAFQQAQVRRREVVQNLADRFGGTAVADFVESHHADRSQKAQDQTDGDGQCRQSALRQIRNRKRHGRVIDN